jgi:hypothetical protein
LAYAYDVKVVVLLLMMCFDQLNPIAITFIVAIDFVRSKFELEKNMFNVGFQLKNL